ncbi:ribonuclease H-like domain-containing protein [Tanacetum coccineum]
MSLESLEVILKTHEKNEYAWGDKYEQMEYDLKIRDLKLEEKQKELDQALKERRFQYLQGMGDSMLDQQWTQTVLQKCTANVTYQGTARYRVPQLVLSQVLGNPEEDLKDYVIIDSGCSGSMTGDKDKLSDFKEFKDFEKVSYVEELKFNLLSVSQICDKKHNVLFTDKECLILSPKFKFVDEDLRMKLSYGTEDWGMSTSKHQQVVKATVGLGVYLQRHSSLIIVESVNRKKYCLVVTDDCSKFSWVFFLAYKDETYDMLHDLIMENGVAERKNRTLIEAARTMLADSLLPIQFWAEAVNTACYVLNRVLVTKPQMKTPYEILMGRSPNISFMRPFGCSLTILNTLDHLGRNQKGKDSDDDIPKDGVFFLQTLLMLRKAKEPRKSVQALADESWVERCKKTTSIQAKEVCVLCDLQKARGYRQEEGVDYDEVFGTVCQIEAISLFLAFASFMGFIVYQHGCQECFLIGNITEGSVMSNSSRFEDPDSPNKSTELSRHFMAWHQAHRAWSMIGYLHVTNCFKTRHKFAVCLCARFQVTPKEEQLQEMAISWKKTGLLAMQAPTLKQTNCGYILQKQNM